MRDKHIKLMEQVRLRISYAKGYAKRDLIKYYKKLKRELNEYDNHKRQLTIY